MKLFRRVTMGKPVIMGRKTFASLPRVLDGRDLIVLTRDRTFAAAGVHAVGSLAEALTVARACAERRGVDEITVIGGADVFRLRSEEHTSELQSLAYLVCRLLLEKKKKI